MPKYSPLFAGGLLAATAAASPASASGPCAVRTASMRSAMVSSASSHVMRVQSPAPRSPARFIGYSSRSL